MERGQTDTLAVTLKQHSSMKIVATNRKFTNIGYKVFYSNSRSLGILCFWHGAELIGEDL